MPRGRSPAVADAAAKKAAREILAYMRANKLSKPKLAEHVGRSLNAVSAALNNNPPAWTPTFIDIKKFICDQAAPAGAGHTDVVESVLRYQRERKGSKGGVSAAATLLRTIADLLERNAAPD